MPSILTESFLNKIKTEGNLNFSSNLKRFFNPIFEKEIFELYKTKQLCSNLSLEELGTDLLYKHSEQPDCEQVEKEKYIYADYNGYECVKFDVKHSEDFLESIYFENEFGEIPLNYSVVDNHILFFEPESKNGVFYLKLKDGYILNDFKIDNNFFVYISYTLNGKNYVSISHLGLEFLEINSDSELNSSKLLFNSETEKLYKFLSGCRKGNLLNVIDSEMNITSLKLIKKYFFEDGGIYYSNLNNGSEPIQIENLFHYEIINIMGLNSMAGNDVKIDSSFSEKIKKIISEKFDDTSNGKLNFYNFYEDKDYFVRYSDRNIEVIGNFSYNFSNGDYKIKVQVGEYSSIYQDIGVTFTLTKNNVVLKKVDTFFIDGFAYFCNLKFFCKKNDSNPFEVLIDVSANESYPIFKEGVTLDKFNNLNKGLIKEKYSELEMEELYEAEFDSEKIIFKNVFDYKNKKWMFMNSEIILENIGSSIDLSNISNYKVYGKHFIKDGKIYSRETDVRVIYSTVSDFSISLISNNKYTDFFMNNQNKVVEIFIGQIGNNIGIHMSSNSNSVEEFDVYDFTVTHMGNQSTELIFKMDTFNEETIGFKSNDFFTLKFYVPSLEDFQIELTNSFNDVEIFESLTNEVVIPYEKNILVTDKFFNKPLFYKFFTDSLDGFEFFDNFGKQINEYISEFNGDDFTIYYNRELGKEYLYNTSKETNVYVNKLKSFENNEDKFYIENKLHKFEKTTYIDYFSVEVLEEINIFFYELEDVTVYTLEPSDSNTKIELKKNITHIKIEGSDKVLFTKTEFKNSLYGNNLIFNKNNSSDVIYVSEENFETNISYQPVNSNIPVKVVSGFEIKYPKINTWIYKNKNDFYFENFKNPSEIFKVMSEENVVEFKNTIANL